MTLLFGVPAAVGLLMLAGPMLATLFASDVFDAYDVEMAARSLVAYSLGLQAFILIKVLAPGYYARQDTRTPVRIGVIAMVANMVFNLLLIFPLQHAGLALATSLSSYLNAFLLLRGLRQSGVYRPDAGWPRLLLQVAVANIAMAGFLLAASPELPQWLDATRIDRVLWLGGAILVGAMVYLGVLLVGGVRPRQLRGRPEVGAG